MAYIYVKSVNRYRNTESGRFVPREQVLAYIESITQAGGDAADTLADLQSSGQLSPADFGIRLKDELKSAYVQDYILGRGGRSSMTRGDWGAIGRMLRDEYKLIDKFVADLEEGKSSPAQTRNRARLYFDTARVAYERGNAAAYGIQKKLPCFPCDGKTRCRGGCRCSWRYEKIRDAEGQVIEIHAFWELNADAEHCETGDGKRGCTQNAAEYNPFVVLTRFGGSSALYVHHNL